MLEEQKLKVLIKPDKTALRREVKYYADFNCDPLKKRDSRGRKPIFRSLKMSGLMPRLQRKNPEQAHKLEKVGWKT